jgi:hypothetical protein
LCALWFMKPKGRETTSASDRVISESTSNQARYCIKNSMRTRRALLVRFLSVVLLPSSVLHPEPIPVRYQEGSVRGYLALRSLDGKLIAAGDLIQSIHGGVLVSRLVYHFKDGSIDDDTAVFTQRGHFRLISDHHIQRGPSFPKPTEVMIKATTGEVTVRYKDKDEERVETSHVDLPPDLSNGILLDILRNVQPDTKETKISYLATTPKPRLIHLVVQPEGEEMFHSGERSNKALKFKIHVDIGGISGVVAPLIGKEPPDTHVWISAGQVPAFLRSEEPLYFWRAGTAD